MIDWLNCYLFPKDAEWPQQRLQIFIVLVQQAITMKQRRLIVHKDKVGILSGHPHIMHRQLQHTPVPLKIDGRIGQPVQIAQ